MESQQRFFNTTVTEVMYTTMQHQGFNTSCFDAGLGGGLPINVGMGGDGGG